MVNEEEKEVSVSQTSSKEIKRESKAEERAVDVLVYFLVEVAKLVRDFGMPVIAFGMGIYVFWLVVTATDLQSSYKLGVGVFLTISGLISQLWIHARENPITRKKSSDAQAMDNQLDRLTTLVEHLVKKTKL